MLARETLEAFELAATYAACIVGCTAFAANHCKATVQRDGGRWEEVLLRDSAPPPKAAGMHIGDVGKLISPSASVQVPVASKATAATGRRRAIDNAARKRVADERAFQKGWMKALGDRESPKPPPVPAQDKLLAIRSRLEEKRSLQASRL